MFFLLDMTCMVIFTKYCLFFNEVCMYALISRLIKFESFSFVYKNVRKNFWIIKIFAVIRISFFYLFVINAIKIFLSNLMIESKICTAIQIDWSGHIVSCVGRSAKSKNWWAAVTAFQCRAIEWCDDELKDLIFILGSGPNGLLASTRLCSQNRNLISAPS